MELQGERLIPATVETTWAALNDPATLKGCIANCESLERTGDHQLAAVVTMKVGPVSARFKGNLTITNVQAPNSYTINFDGQGGMAGFGKGSADVSLTPSDTGGTTLKYLARATVGGKIAQIGSRLIDSAAAKITNDFFAAFETQLAARGSAIAGGSATGFGSGDGLGAESGLATGGGGAAPQGGPGGTAAAPDTSGTTTFRLADRPHGASGDASAIGAPHAFAGMAGMAGMAADPAIVRYWALIGAVIALGAVYFAIR